MNMPPLMISLGVLGIAFDDLTVVGKGFLVLPGTRVCTGSPAVGIGVFGIATDGFGKILNGAFIIPAVHPGPAALEKTLGLIGVILDQPFKCASIATVPSFP